MTGDPGDAALATVRAEVTDLRQRVATLERAPTIQVGPGSPSVWGFVGRDGTPYAQSAAPTFWVRIGAAWRGVGLPLT
jgi:hypothetical protein